MAIATTNKKDIYATTFDKQDGEIIYTLDDVTITASVKGLSYAPPSTDIVIKNKITFNNNDYSVTSIQDQSFREERLTYVIIPDSVTSIENNVFENNKLITVTIPNNLYFIYNNSFKENPDINTLFITKLDKLDNIVDLLKTNSVFISGDSSSATVRMYALDKIQASYANDIKDKYELNKGQTQALSVDKAFNPEVKTINATNNEYNNPEGINIDIDLNIVTIEWFKDNNSIGRSNNITVTSSGTYHAVVNGKYKQNDIVITYKKANNPNTGNTNTDQKHKDKVKYKEKINVNGTLPTTGSDSITIVSALVIITSLFSVTYYIKKRI